LLTLTDVPEPTRLAIKRALFPGLDLHTRCRYRYLPRQFRTGPIDTLDAGCGNGALAYAAYKLGNRVLAISVRADEIRRNQEYFEALLPNCDRLQFREMNIYDLPKLGRTFDQIVCSETLEHITRDAEVVASFADLLRPGGVLHLCCPFAMHPSNNLGRVAGPEDGGHVRDGYTLQTYQCLLESVGLKIVACGGLGSPLLVRLDRHISELRGRHGDAAVLPLFLAYLPLSLLDRPNPRVPLSLYVQAVKEPRAADPSLRSG
jgi:SAM-dependent methyltransferase